MWLRYCTLPHVCVQFESNSVILQSQRYPYSETYGDIQKSIQKRIQLILQIINLQIFFVKTKDVER